MKKKTHDKFFNGKIKSEIYQRVININKYFSLVNFLIIYLCLPIFTLIK